MQYMLNNIELNFLVDIVQRQQLIELLDVQFVTGKIRMH